MSKTRELTLKQIQEISTLKKKDIQAENFLKNSLNYRNISKRDKTRPTVGLVDQKQQQHQRIILP